MSEYSFWDYRVLCDEAGAYAFVEVYYTTDGSIKAYTSEPASPYGNCERDLESDLEKMAEALNKPTLYPADMPQ